MMAAPSPSPADLVCAALRQPQRLSTLTLAGWDVLVRQARGAGLLARIGCMLDAQGSLARVPDAPRAHLQAAMTLADFQRGRALRELALAQAALAPTAIVPLLLGGAAYAAAGLLPSMGRTFTDIDIAVPEAGRGEVEAALLARGWSRGPHARPSEQAQREGMLLVHHVVLPEAEDRVPDTNELGVHAHPLDDDGRFAVLDPVDMVLHAMVRLFHRADVSQALRDLSDLDLLLRHCGRAPDFWTGLEQRATEPVLARALHHGLRYTQALLGTPVPPAIQKAAAARGPGLLPATLSDALWTRALRPRHPTVSDGWTPAALLALRVRARWRREQPSVLVLQRPVVEAD